MMWVLVVVTRSSFGIRHSQPDASLVNYADLRRYNTIILPSGYRDMGEGMRKKVLSDWMEQGGTLIAHAASSSALASEQGIGSSKTSSKYI